MKRLRIRAAGLALLMALPFSPFFGAITADGQEGAPAAGGNAGGKNAAPKVEKDVPKAKGVRPGQKKARRMLTDAFPRTKGLLAWLKDADPEIHAKLLGMSRTIAAEHEAEALEFARANHPELLALMTQLRERKPAAYTAAVTDLAASSLKLRQTRERDPDAHASALQAWVLRSQARLVAARRLVELPAEAPPSGEELRMLTEAENQDRHGIELQILNHERKIEKLRARLAEDPRVAAERRLGQLVRKMRKK